MKFTLLTAIFLLSFVASPAQSKKITAVEYRAAFDFAVRETNAAFPFIFTFSVEIFDKGRVVSVESEIDERQAQGIERITKTIRDAKNITTIYQINAAFGQIYCSGDAVTWKGPQENMCSGPSMLYGPRESQKSDYGLEIKTVGGEKVKVYREYLIYAPADRGGKKEFKETLATIDSRGFFISVVNDEGALDPKDIVLTRKQSWDMKTKFAPIVAPK